MSASIPLAEQHIHSRIKETDGADGLQKVIIADAVY